MNIILALVEDQGVAEALKAAMGESDLLLVERAVEEAVRRLISVKADAVIVDDGPRLGFRALAELQKSVPGIPVIVLSSRGDAETLANYALGGSRTCVVKPFSCETLQEAVSRVTRVEAQGGIPAVSGDDREAGRHATLGQHQTALRWLGRISSHIQDPLRASQSLVDAASDIFDAARGAVLLDTEDGVRIAASVGVPSSVVEPLRLDYGSGLMRCFELNPCLVDRTSAQDDASTLKELHLLGARMGVPLLCGGHVVGAILIGDKASGLDYTFEERELLTVLGRCAAIAFENVRLYHDISRQRRSLDAVMTNISAGVVTVRTDKTIAMMNQAAERILQLRSVEVVGRSVQRLGSGFADVVLSTLADAKPRLRQEVRDAAIDATLGLSVTPLGNEGVVVIFSKIPEEKAGREEIAYSPFWEYLASRVAQEIKNPMVAINTFAQLLPRKYDSEDFRHAFADVVQKEVSRINGVVETLFEFARHPRLVLRLSDVNDTVRGVLRSFQSELDARAIAVEATFGSDLPPAELDTTLFGQAVHNVVQNAIDAMPAGGVLRVSTTKKENGCEVVVSDTGPGVPGQDASLVFMPFFSTKEQGMGLGLTIASRIMKQHHGELGLAATADGCNAFRFSLPAGKTSHADHPSN